MICCGVWAAPILTLFLARITLSFRIARGLDESGRGHVLLLAFVSVGMARQSHITNCFAPTGLEDVAPCRSADVDGKRRPRGTALQRVVLAAITRMSRRTYFSDVILLRTARAMHCHLAALHVIIRVTLRWVHPLALPTPVVRAVLGQPPAARAIAMVVRLSGAGLSDEFVPQPRAIANSCGCRPPFAPAVTTLHRTRVTKCCEGCCMAEECVWVRAAVLLPWPAPCAHW